MKIFISITILLYCTSFSISQEKTTLLEASGEIPGFLSKQTHEAYLIPDITSWQYLNKLDKQSALELIYTSNMIVFGDPVSDYCTQLIRTISGNAINVYTVRSNSIGTFSNEHGDLFITTGLISRLSDESQLAFFLLRELELSPFDHSGQHYKNAGILTLEKLISLVGTYSNEQLESVEKKVIDQLTSKGYAQHNLLSSYDILLYKDAPFLEKPFDWNYFNQGNVFVPQVEYTAVVNPKPRLYTPEKQFPEITARKNKWGTGTSSSSDQVSSMYLVNGSLFNKIVECGRMESVNLRIMNAEFIPALYEIYVLESSGFSNEYLHTMKVLAWWGVAKDRSNEIEKVDFTEYQVSDNDGAYFSRYIKRQRPSAILAFGFRHTYDQLKKSPESVLYTNILKDLIRLSRKHNEFSLNQFYTVTYQSVRNNNAGSSVNATDTLKNYHLFMLPDVVSDPAIKRLFSDSLAGSTTNYANKPVAYKLFSTNTYKKGRTQNQKQQAKISIDQLNSALTKHNIRIAHSKQIYTLDDYQQKYQINYTFFQQYYHTRFNSPVLPIKSTDIVRQALSDQNALLGFGFYNHAYRPKLRGFHLIGLVGVTLPYVLPELFFRGHKTQTIVFLFNAETGEMVNHINRKYNDSFSKYNLHNDILNTTLNLVHP